MHIFTKKQKCLNLVPKVPYLGIFGKDFKTTIIIIEISTLQFVYLQNFAKKRMSKFGTKNALFAYFWVGILKQYCHISNQHFRICLIATFAEKQKCLNLGPKMSYWVFLKKKMPYLGIFGLEFENNIVIFEISTLKFV